MPRTTRSPIRTNSGPTSSRTPTIPLSRSQRPTLSMKTQPMPAVSPPRPNTLASYQPSTWDKMKSRVQHSVLNQKVFATERRRLIGAGVGGIFAGAILHALITGKNDE